MFSANPKSVSIIQYLTTVLAVVGLFYFDFTLQEYLLVILGHFLYSGIGVSMMMHRYYTHNSFEFRSNIIKWICTWFAIVAGRGSMIGWTYLHRMHHKYSDTKQDPHYPSLSFKGIFFPKYSQFDKHINLRLVKDLLTKENIFIDKYYILFLIIWAVTLLLISPALFYFFWVLPVALTHLLLNSFLYLGHKYGYHLHETKDNSTNLWPYGFLLWGEGWHNNHHKDPKRWNLQEKWWELDVVGLLIGVLKK